MRQYLDLVRYILDHGEKKMTARESGRFPSLAVRRAMICGKGFLF